MYLNDDGLMTCVFCVMTCVFCGMICVFCAMTCVFFHPCPIHVVVIVP